ncbi:MULTISPECIES: GreA/GreB family elongation factor [Maribacter]|uniref:GreA/GreB family elongation factor n=1 Tax=Maribacter TaxID=252356 RepID=UPI00047DBEAD|nr:GreA/GreB family elongation factor [Maribacter sp. Hel_I_7]|tara:strand:- start:3255 stop:3761 length:507 start_codon:yes stop_codon:yes gene_type:complete
MSRGFVKEEDQEEIPMVPPRADLPVGAVNYVTKNGFNKLLEERQKLQNEKESLPNDNEKERRITSNLINAKLQLLNERISSAKMVNLEEQPKNEVRFGATISLLIDSAKTDQEFQIVGVDEANIAENKISFLSPIARILISKKVGDTAILNLGKVERLFKITNISYSN